MILKNRQSIDPEEHNNRTNEEQQDETKENVEDKSNQQFPPRNAQRRKDAEMLQQIITNMKMIITNTHKIAIIH